MDTTDHEEYVAFPISNVHESTQRNPISREEIAESIDECTLKSSLSTEMTEAHVAVEILTEHSDGEDENSVMYPVYIKEEEQHQYASGDDESMAVEALRQLGGMYPTFDDKKVMCSTCKNLFFQSEMTKHQQSCIVKFSCSTCYEQFDRKSDLNNHMVCHQVDRPHACRTCGNLFRSKSNLQAHMSQVHHIDKPHKCTICGADFQRPSSLSNHMKIHTYVAGRALAHHNQDVVIQTEAFKKWPDPSISEPSTSTTQSTSNYEASEVQWAVSQYSFHQNVQSNLTVVNNNGKIDGLQEFTVIPNGEVTQFDYGQSNTIENQQYITRINSFDDPESLGKIDPLPYTSVEAEKNSNTPNEIKSYGCQQCGMVFTRISALATHKKVHISKGWMMPIECEYCDKQFQDSSHLASHQTTCAKKLQCTNDPGLIVNKWGKHACSECGKKFTTKQKMYRHQWIHRKKTHSCEVCGSQFEKQNQLDEHRLAAHPGDSPFTCNECGKSFVSRQGLWEHGRTHAGSPAHFQCDICSKTFSSRQGYLIHRRTHTGERPYGCKFCWKAFRDGGTLRKHERIHTGERPHVCPLCSRAFNQKVVLREHVRWVHAAGKNESQVTGPPFPCPLCGAINQDRDELCAHIVKHSDKMIADAKAKSSVTKTKSPKKKPAKNSDFDRKDKKIGEQVRKTLEGHIINTKQGETLLLVTSDKHIASEINEKSDVDNLSPASVESLNLIAVENTDNTTFLVPSEQETIIHAISNRISDVNTLLIPVSKQNNTVHFISPTDTQINTLHVIGKSSESLTESSAENQQFSGVKTDSNVSEINMDTISSDSVNQSENLNDKNSFESTVVQYLNESDNESELLICGICGDEFESKHILMEHVKIHI